MNKAAWKISLLMAAVCPLAVQVFAAPAKPVPVKPPTPATAPKPKPVGDGSVFSFEDYLERHWENEAVRIPLTEKQASQVKEKQVLVGPGGAAVPYQVVQEGAGKTPAIEFLADVLELQKSTYNFRADASLKAPASDLTVQNDGDAIRITNHLAGIALRKTLKPGEGPVGGIRLRSGKWIGGSRLNPELVPATYSAKILNQGPVFCEVQCSADFGEGRTWQTTYRLNANEPVIEVSESIAMGDGSGVFSLSLSDGFNANRLFFRYGQQLTGMEIGINASQEIKPGSVFVLEPWLRWSMRPEQGPVFNIYSDDDPDMLAVGAGFAGTWVDSKIPKEKRAAPYGELVQDDKGLHLDFSLKNGERRWMIINPDKDASLALLNKDDPHKSQYAPSPAHKYVIKHGQFPLNLVKDYDLSWDSEKEQFPHLFITRADVARLRAARGNTPIDERQCDHFIATRPMNQWTMQDPIKQELETDDPRCGKFLLEELHNFMKMALDTFLTQPQVPYGSAPHHQQILGLVPSVADAVLDCKSMTPELRKRLLAQFAFMSYAINRDDYWSEEKGFCGLPNMTTSVLGYRVAIGSMISRHPKAGKWVNDALAQMKQQLYDYSDTNGGWLEAPHYGMVAFDALLGSFMMAHNSGISDMVFDPRMKTAALWYAKMITPPDSRAGGFRHIPPIGNSYINEPTGEFGLLAAVWKTKDPQFASEMQWLHKQNRSWAQPGIGGGYPTIDGYRGLIVDPSIPEKAPHYTSEIFPKAGVILRNGHPTDRETHLHLLAGSFSGWRSHWDEDSGSFTLWGKGRIIADDFGYYNPAIEDHNMMASNSIVQRRSMEIQTFATDKDFDYVSGERISWRRQIEFLKNDDPLAPNYFVLCDSLKENEAATWRLWMTASKVTPNANTVQVEGKDDVDTDFYFASPIPPTFKTEEKTRTAGAGIYPDGSQHPMDTTQIGLIFDAAPGSANTYVIYPRLKTQEAPEITTLADGKGVRIKSDYGTDYVFLSPEPFTFQEGTISFSGTSGAVRFHGKQLRLQLGDAGRVEARGQILESKTAASKAIALK